jgi:hypothetical protein
MRKPFLLAFILLFAGYGMASADDWGTFDSQDMLFASAGAYMGYGWAGMIYWDGTPWITGFNFDGIPTCIDASVAFLPAFGPLHFGPRIEAISATYITGFIKDSMGVEHDQAVIELGIDAYLSYTGIEWLSAYAFAGITADYYAVFDPIHINDGAEEYCFGIRGGAGISLIPISLNIGADRLRFLAGPELIAGLIIPTDLLYPYLRVHGLITVQYVFAP